MIKHQEIYKMDSNNNIRVFFIEQNSADYRMVTGVLNGNAVSSKWTTAKPKNIGKANETTPEIQASLEIEAKYDKKLKSGYFTTIEEAKANPEGKFFEPMLATEIDKVKEKDRAFPLILDPKLDGMRMTSSRLEQISRRGNIVPTVPHIAAELVKFFKKHPNIRLDGEVYNHEYREDFNTLMSIARKTKPGDTDLQLSKKKLQYHIYDMFDYDNPTMPAIERKRWLNNNVVESNSIKIVDWIVVTTKEQFDYWVKQHVLLGYEGSIARVYNSPYVNKRTKTLMKIKNFITEEFEITKIIAGKGNRSDIAGTVFVDIGEKDPVGCGIRGSWSHCKWLLDNAADLIGKDATIRHFGKTPDGSLRFPVCIDVNRPD